MPNREEEEVYRIEDNAPMDAPNEASENADRSATPYSPYRNEPPQRRNSNTGLWITIVILAVIILAGGAWIAAHHFFSPDAPASDDSAQADEDRIEVVSYETDDTPTAAPAPRQPEETKGKETAEESIVADFVGSLINEEGSPTVSVAVSLAFEDSGSVQGTSQNGDKSFSLSGRYDRDTHRLLLYEDGGGCFDGTLHEDGKYAGQYRNGAETPVSFSMSHINGQASQL